jgi:hypothetical protein
MSSFTFDRSGARPLGGDRLLGPLDELVVHGLIGALGCLDEVGAGVEAEDEAHAVGVEAVELRRERVVGVPAQADLCEAGLSAQGD